MVKRLINLLKTRSFFLFGARGTGKTSLLNKVFDAETTYYVDLLEEERLDRYQISPSAFREEMDALPKSVKWVVVDEVQKHPALLNTVHKLIESWKNDSRNTKFALTGSSARKLKRESNNLLAGRALVNFLFPLVANELKDQFNLQQALTYGTLPEVYLAKDNQEKEAILKSYTSTFIKEEIWSEQLIRKIQPFKRFIEISAQMNGKILNYSSIARDCGVDLTTVQEYYQILEDTLVGFHIESYNQSVRKSQRVNPKFYIFDLGVQRAINRTLSVPLIPHTNEFGNAFEHFIICEIYRLNHYYNKEYKLSYLRTKDDAEIDLIIERPGLATVFLEIKSGTRIEQSHLKHLIRFKKEIKNTEAFCFSLDPIDKKIEGVLCLPWEKGLKEIGLC